MGESTAIITPKNDSLISARRWRAATKGAANFCKLVGHRPWTMPERLGGLGEHQCSSGEPRALARWGRFWPPSKFPAANGGKIRLSKGISGHVNAVALRRVPLSSPASRPSRLLLRMQRTSVGCSGEEGASAPAGSPVPLPMAAAQRSRNVLFDLDPACLPPPAAAFVASETQVSRFQQQNDHVRAAIPAPRYSVRSSTPSSQPALGNPKVVALVRLFTVRVTSIVLRRPGNENGRHSQREAPRRPCRPQAESELSRVLR